MLHSSSKWNGVLGVQWMETSNSKNSCLNMTSSECKRELSTYHSQGVQSAIDAHFKDPLEKKLAADPTDADAQWRGTISDWKEAAPLRARSGQKPSATRLPLISIQSTQWRGTISDLKEAAPSRARRGQQLSASRTHIEAQRRYSKSAGTVFSKKKHTVIQECAFMFGQHKFFLLAPRIFLQRIGSLVVGVTSWTCVCHLASKTTHDAHAQSMFVVCAFPACSSALPLLRFSFPLHDSTTTTHTPIQPRHAPPFQPPADHTQTQCCRLF